MSFLRLLPIMLMVILGLASPLQAQSLDEHPAKASLILDHTTVKPGQEFYAIFKLNMPPKWHSYWLNPGDAGLPTELTWTLPQGITVTGPVQWPAPKKFVQAGDVVGYGYEEEMILLIPMKASKDLEIGKTMEVKVKADWLVCDDKICLPGDATLKTMLNIASKEVSQHKDWVNKAKNQQAKSMQPALKVIQARTIPAGGIMGRVQYEIKLPEDLTIKSHDWMPAPMEDFDSRNVKVLVKEGTLSVSLVARLKQVPSGESSALPSFSGILQLKNAENQIVSYAIELPLTTTVKQ